MRRIMAVCASRGAGRHSRHRRRACRSRRPRRAAQTRRPHRRDRQRHRDSRERGAQGDGGLGALAGAGGEPRKRSARRVLDALIDQHLEYEDAARFGPAPPDAAQIEEAMNRLRDRLKAEGKDPAAEFASGRPDRGGSPRLARAPARHRALPAGALRADRVRRRAAGARGVREALRAGAGRPRVSPCAPFEKVADEMRKRASERAFDDEVARWMQGAAPEVARRRSTGSRGRSGRTARPSSLSTAPAADQDARAVIAARCCSWRLAGPRRHGAHRDAVPPAAVQRGVAVPMRDGVVLRADVLRPAHERPLSDARPPHALRPQARNEEDEVVATALARGYAVVLQDVRGRYGSAGEFVPYAHEGPDGYDTIEWAAAQPWSTGDVGTFGLSYPAAVQWLAAVESPPHLKAMVPAMTFSSPRNFFYAGGAWDLSWISWIWDNIAPDARVKQGPAGSAHRPRGERGVEGEEGEILPFRLPLTDLPELRAEAPFYFDWLAHPPAGRLLGLGGAARTLRAASARPS